LRVRECPVGPEPNFNESVYCNFFDRAQKRGGFVRSL
jgi:hypothetical protein